MSDDCLAMLNVGVLHGDEHNIRFKPFDDEVCRVRQQHVIFLGIDVRSGRGGFSDRKSDEVLFKLDTLRLQRFDRQLLRLEQEGRIAENLRCQIGNWY